MKYFTNTYTIIQIYSNYSLQFVTLVTSKAWEIKYLIGT